MKTKHNLENNFLLSFRLKRISVFLYSLITPFLVLTFVSSFLYAQKLPKTYRIAASNKANAVTEVVSSSPGGNSVENTLLVGDTLWVATTKGLSKSTNGGTTWVNYYNTDAFGTESISAIAYANGIFCAATWDWISTAYGDYPEGSGIRLTTDYGKTWKTISQPLDNTADTVIIYGTNRITAKAITTEIQNFIRDIAITEDNTIWIVSNSAGLRKSTDLGNTWTRVLLPPDNLDSIKPSDVLNFQLYPLAGSTGNLNHIGFSILAVNKDTLYVGTAGGINKTTDGGISWVKFSHQNQSSPISGNHILRIKQNPFDKTIWAATWKAEDDQEFWGVSFTKNGGITWKVIMNDSYTHDFIFPQIKSGSNILSTDVIAMTENGLYRSNNEGSTWIKAPAILDKKKNLTVLSEYFSCGTVNNQKSPAELWFGSEDGLIELTQNPANFWDGDWTVFLTSESVQTAGDFYAFPNPFNPALRPVRIKFYLSNQSNVTIRIFDFGMNLVKTIVQNAPRNTGENYELWSGRDEKGKLIPNGVYFYRIDVNDEKPLFGKILAVR